MSYKTSVAIGLFDGVHLGHRAVLETAVNTGLIPCAATFSGDISPQKNIKLILSENDREEQIKQSGIEKVFFIVFNSIKDLSPDVFIKKLCETFKAGHIVCGEDFRFGKDRTGDINTLAGLCEKLDIGFTVTSEQLFEGEKISSGKIRTLLEIGEIKAANELLDYDFYYNLEIIHGKEIGRKIGFPTINQVIPNELVKIKNGVYLSKIELDKKTYSGITNFGSKPTVHYDGVPILETYIDGFDTDIYGKKVKVFPQKYLRPEVKFESLGELKKQLEEDKLKINEGNF